MQTYSHFLVTAALYRVVPSARQLSRKAVYWGSIGPDLALLSLSVGSFVYFRVFEGMQGREIFRHIYGTLFFTDPYWILLQNTLQAPILLVGALAFLWRRYGRHVVASAGFALCLSCLFHATLDILTHHNDGPLVFFPFDWTTRFYSPISYWDRNHYGDIFSSVEHALDLVILLTFVLPYLFRRFFGTGRSSSETVSTQEGS